MAVNEMLKIADAQCTALKMAHVKNAGTHPRLERKTSNPRDFNCFLIKHPDDLTADEKIVKHICEAFPSDTAIIIEIPS